MLCLIAPWLLAFPSADESITNGGFEDRGRADDPVPGWMVELGAQNGGEHPSSLLEIDRKEKHSGKGSLHFQGKSSTRGWLIAKQSVPVRPGGSYELVGWTKTEGVKREGIQFNNCYLMLLFFDGGGELVAREIAVPGQPSSPWTKHELRIVAPDSARKGWIYAFLSKTGELWVDDLELEIEGGEELPEFKPVFHEDFAKARRLPSKWKKEVGATNGTGGESTKIEIDREDGAPGSPQSLKLSGGIETLKWFALRREFKAQPGEIFRLTAHVKAENVRQEGVQFANFHLHLFFVDRKGEMLGTAHFVHPGRGSYDWKEVSVQAVAPLETRKVRSGIFLSMSGAVWVDELLLESQPGGEPPYADFVEIEKKGITLHYSSEDPNAKHARGYLQRLVDHKAEICRRLEVEWTDPIDVFVYENDAKGRQLTGASLDFADPSGRKVHQRWNSYIAHEMVHVIAHNSLQHAQTGLLGEGIAVWLDSRSDAAHHRLAAELLAKGELPGLAALLSDFGNQSNSYPASGSFCGWFIAEHGLEPFKAIYPLKDPSTKAEELLGRRLEEMEADWHAELEKYK